MKLNLSNPPDERFLDDVNAGCIVVFCDEWGNERTMEARAVGVMSGGVVALLGYQLDGGVGIAPEQLWKRVEGLHRIAVAKRMPSMPALSLPPQYAEHIERLLALSPNTIWDQTRHETSTGDD